MDVLWLRISCLGWFCNQEELGKKEEEERCCAETAVLAHAHGWEIFLTLLRCAGLK